MEKVFIPFRRTAECMLHAGACFMENVNKTKKLVAPSMAAVSCYAEYVIHIFDIISVVFCQTTGFLEEFMYINFIR